MLITWAMHKWRQHFLGSKFVIQTDQKALEGSYSKWYWHLNNNIIWSKLLGFSTIVYKPDNEKKVTVALSRRPGESITLSISNIQFHLVDDLKEEKLSDQHMLNQTLSNSIHIMEVEMVILCIKEGYDSAPNQS